MSVNGNAEMLLTTFAISAGGRTSEDWGSLMKSRGKWRRRADSNRRIEVLQTSPLTTWVRRLPVEFNIDLFRLSTQVLKRALRQKVW